MNDRLLRGTLAGVIAELACVVINYASEKLLRFAKVRWVEMLSHLIVGRAMTTPADTAIGYLFCSIVAGGLGYVFARFMVPERGEGNYYFRAITLGVGFMTLSYALGHATKTPTMINIAPETAITTLTSVVAWGLLAGYLMWRWDRVYA